MRLTADTAIHFATTGGCTALLVMKRSADSAGNLIFPLGFQEVGAAARFGLGFDGTNIMTTLTSTVVSASSLAGTVADGWMAVGATKATGLSTPRFHKYVYSTRTGSHENGTIPQPDGSSAIGPGGSIVVAKLRDGYSFTAPGSYAALLILSHVLSDQEFESAAVSIANMKSAVRSTSSFAGKGLWLFDGALTGTNSPAFPSTIAFGGPTSIDTGGSPVGLGNPVMLD